MQHNLASSSSSLNDGLSTIVEEVDNPEPLAPPSMTRQETLETSPSQRAEHDAELSDVLGTSHAHLDKLSAKTYRDLDTGEPISIFWEQYSSHAQLELDIDLESNVLVQGDWLRGHIAVTVAPREPFLVCLQFGKIRLLGLEWLSKHEERSVFYSFSSSLLLVAPAFKTLLAGELDEEGFGVVISGSFSIPFAFEIPTSSKHGKPKGHFSHQAASIRTIALITLRVKYPLSNRHSIAHFYRECTLWPRLEPQTVLNAATRPIQLTNSAGDIQLTASLYAPTWVAGQDCRIKVVISNNSQTTVKNLDFGLFNTVTIFPSLPGKEAEHTTTQLSKVSLRVKQPPTPGHATAKGWWSGVKPGEMRTVYHYLPIPPNALSVDKGHLFEVTTFIRVTVLRGLLLPNVSVDLPFVIVNAHSFLRPESPTLHPPNDIPDSSTSHNMQTNALRQDRDNRPGSNIQLADNDQETLANNCSQAVDHSTNDNPLGFLSDLHSAKTQHISSEDQDNMPPPYLTNFSRRVEEKRLQLKKMRSLQAEEYDSELLEGLDIRSEQLSSTQGGRRSLSDGEDPETRTTAPSRSPSPEPNEPIRAGEDGSIAIVSDASKVPSDDLSDSNINGSRETPGNQQVDGDSMSGIPNPMTSSSAVSPKRTGDDRDVLKSTHPAVASIPSLTPNCLNSNGPSVVDPPRGISNLPPSGSVPKLGAVKERIKALEMRSAE
ncbi:hypothetical protein CVT24_005363 [Panaeolus cyanescens]|uniref:Arrestin C-terminal-like domain-containing protein n=1 Tax=Panaeolus cyanescens TaxID=181874 RepID=A0A409Y8W2_9AGAR|nr:hypothetical protein CVT24_005363 [Panaeolus cyanescens]